MDTMQDDVHSKHLENQPRDCLVSEGGWRLQKFLKNDWVKTTYVLQ